MGMVRLWRAVVAALLGALAGLALMGASSAGAAEPRFVPCEGVEGARCATLPVPVDRSGAVPGRVGLRVARVAPKGPRQGVVVAISGGPGQSAVADTDLFAETLGPVLGRRELVLFDQRGTGRSGALRCRALGRLETAATAKDLDRLVRACAGQLGPRRDFYTTTESVEDLEAVRALVGAERISLYSVSYGTKLALAYAARYPERVERVVVDSVVLPEGVDPFGRSTFAAIPTALGDLCARGRCRGITADAARDAARLAGRLRRAPQRAPVVGPDGRVRRTRLGQEDLFGVLLSGDLDPLVRARTPAAVRAALAGDLPPLMRLVASSAEQDDGGVNDALFLATVCGEDPVPWDPAATPADRRRQTAAVVGGLPAGAFGAFGPPAARLVAPQLDFCAGWPAAAPHAPLAPLVPPPVPLLALAGAGDLRTPVADAQALAARYPGSSVVAVPGSGHGVLLNDLSGCVRRALSRFFAGRPVRGCPGGEPLLLPEVRPPSRLRDVPPARGVSGQRGQVLGAVGLTLEDVVLSLAVRFLNDETGRIRGTGLRAGRFAMGPRGLRLTSVVHVPGVSVSGALDGPLRISAAGMSGTLRLTDEGRLSGTLGGRPVAARDVNIASLLLIARDARDPGSALARPRPRVGGAGLDDVKVLVEAHDREDPPDGARSDHHLEEIPAGLLRALVGAP